MTPIYLPLFFSLNSPFTVFMEIEEHLPFTNGNIWTAVWCSIQTTRKNQKSRNIMRYVTHPFVSLIFSSNTEYSET